MTGPVFPERVLYFPITPFDEFGAVDERALDAHLVSRLEHDPGGVFVACGTGEFHALSTGEYQTTVRRGVTATAGKVPVVAGTGGPLGHAMECAAIAERSGADALLVMPPYLVAGPQPGIIAYVTAIADATELPIIVYHRGSARLTVDTFRTLAEDSRIVGFKDGVGDISLAQEFVVAARESGRTDLQLFNGLPTAELSQRAYRSVGIPLYSSAAFAMAPRVASAWFRAYIAHDEARLDSLIAGFYAPLARLRDSVPGYAVSLIKAGVMLSGEVTGQVRPPLVPPSEFHLRALATILEREDELVQ